MDFIQNGMPYVLTEEQVCKTPAAPHLRDNLRRFDAGTGVLADKLKRPPDTYVHPRLATR